jgi:hypothetical protein
VSALGLEGARERARNLHRRAITALHGSGLGEAAIRLSQLADRIVERDF